MPVLFSTRITSPYTLVSDDIVELVLSHLPHSPTQTDIATDSNSDLVSGLDWSTRPAGEERLAIPWPTDTVDVEPDNSLPKRSPKSLHTRGISSKTRITSLDAVRSAQSLISAMRDVATRTDDDLPLRQSQISVIRSVLGQQFVFPDEAAADEGDICALPTVTREVYGTVFSTATGRNPAAVAAPVVYQSTIQPTGPPPITPIPVAADPNPQPPFSFTIVSTSTTTATVSTTATTMTTVATTANSTVTATTTLVSTSTATVISSVSGTTTVTSIQTPTSTTTTTTTTCPSQSPSTTTSTFTITDKQTSVSTTTTTAFAPTTLVITISLPTAINTIPLALAQYKQERM
ncbi:hypothetical protein IW146_007021 [Coemansia sp. RSA 922]|nr:hypothetical protein IW146_007021 [Coemansia sp. RSA 922]